MSIADLKKSVSEKLASRDYYGMFEIIDRASNMYLDENSLDYDLCIELITQNQDLYEYMGASKQFEMAFELLNKLITNRNRLFVSCLTQEQQALKSIFKRAVGDYSTAY
jgi:hypothetical protein